MPPCICIICAHTTHCHTHIPTYPRNHKRVHNYRYTRAHLPQVIPYATLQQALDIATVRELEDFIITECFYRYWFMYDMIPYMYDISYSICMIFLYVLCVCVIVVYG